MAKAIYVLACNDCFHQTPISQAYFVNGILDGLLQIIWQIGLVKFFQHLDDGAACPLLGCLQLGTQGCGQGLHQLALWVALGKLFQMVQLLDIILNFPKLSHHLAKQALLHLGCFLVL